MLKSMTAYGRSSSDYSCGRFTVELRSVNKRFLEFSLQLPSALHCFEADLRRWLSADVLRGHLVVKVDVEFHDQAAVNLLKPNLSLVKQLKSAWAEIADTLQLPAGGANLPIELLTNRSDLWLKADGTVDIDSVRSAFREAVSHALQPLMMMKVSEGAAIHHDLSQRLQIIAKHVAILEAKSPKVVEIYQQKLKNRLEELLASANIEHEASLVRELALYAEKIDIAEEITRLKAHIQQFADSLNSVANEPKGKTLEFILQEMLRETNTIASKSDDLESSQETIFIKSEIERMREQIQNVE